MAWLLLWPPNSIFLLRLLNCNCNLRHPLWVYRLQSRLIGLLSSGHWSRVLGSTPRVRMWGNGLILSRVMWNSVPVRILWPCLMIMWGDWCCSVPNPMYSFLWAIYRLMCTVNWKVRCWTSMESLNVRYSLSSWTVSRTRANRWVYSLIALMLLQTKPNVILASCVVS